MKKGASFVLSSFFVGYVFAQSELMTVPTPQEVAKKNALALLKQKIEEEKANFTIRHYLNSVIGENIDQWPEWENSGVFYRSFIAPHVSQDKFSSGLEGSPQAEILYGKKPLVLAKVSTHEQQVTLSEVLFEVLVDKFKVSRKLLEREVTIYEGTKKNRSSRKEILPAIFKTTTGAKVVKQIYPGGKKQTIVAYTQPGVYTPSFSTHRRVSQEFVGAVLYDYVYFNQGDALHRTIGAESDLGKKHLIGTLEASGGCARLGSKEAAFAREKINSVGLPRSRVQVVETDDMLSCVDNSGKTSTFYIASDRTSGVLVDSEKNAPLFIGLRGETSWKASTSLGRKIVLSSMPEILETTVEELPKIEVTYATLQDKSPFKAFGQEYSVTIQKQILSLNVTSKFKFEELSSATRAKEEVKESLVSLNCKKTN